MSPQCGIQQKSVRRKLHGDAAAIQGADPEALRRLPFEGEARPLLLCMTWETRCTLMELRPGFEVVYGMMSS